MINNALFWLGLLGLISGVMVGISLLENGSSFVRNGMFSIGIAVTMFAFIHQLGRTKAPHLGGMLLDFWTLLCISFSLGAGAGMVIAFSLKGGQLAAFLGGGLAGMTTFILGRYLPPGSFGYTGMDDIPTVLTIGAAMLVGGGTYYLLYKWGKSEEKWD